MISLILFSFFFILSHVLICRLKIINTSKSIIYIFIICLFIFIDFSNSKKIDYFIFYFTSKFTFLIIYIEFFSLINRGFTISILTSLGDKKFKLKDIENLYSGKKGLKWMLQKRINGMLYFKVVNIKHKNYKLTHFGKLVFYFTKISQIVLNIKKLGQ